MTEPTLDQVKDLVNRANDMASEAQITHTRLASIVLYGDGSGCVVIDVIGDDYIVLPFHANELDNVLEGKHDAQLRAGIEAIRHASTVDRGSSVTRYYAYHDINDGLTDGGLGLGGLRHG